MKELERNILFEFECKEAEIEEITTMLWYVFEDYYVIKEKDLYTKANNYDRLETYLVNIHSLLYSLQNEMRNFIDDTYKEIRKGKETNNEQNKKIKTIPFYNEKKKKVEKIPIYNNIKMDNNEIIYS